MSRSSLWRGALVLLILALPVAVGPSVGATESPPSSVRLSLWAACTAWREHFTDLIDQHRIAHEMNEDALFDFVLQFIAARDACSSRRGYEIGLRMYEAILLGPVQQRPMK
jgi:hypothetical protein